MLCQAVPPGVYDVEWRLKPLEGERDIRDVKFSGFVGSNLEFEFMWTTTEQKKHWGKKDYTTLSVGTITVCDRYRSCLLKWSTVGDGINGSMTRGVGPVASITIRNITRLKKAGSATDISAETPAEDIATGDFVSFKESGFTLKGIVTRTRGALVIVELTEGIDTAGFDKRWLKGGEVVMSKHQCTVLTKAATDTSTSTVITKAETDDRSVLCMVRTGGNKLLLTQLIQVLPQAPSDGSESGLTSELPDLSRIDNLPEDTRSYSSVWNGDAIGTGWARSMLNSVNYWFWVHPNLQFSSGKHL